MADRGEFGDESSGAIYQASFDPDVEPASDAVVSAVSAVTGDDPNDLEPVDTVVDPIVFDALVRRQRRPVRVTFVYNGCEVTVFSSGEIVVRGHDAALTSGHVARYDCRSHSEAVARAIAATRDVEVEEIDPLYDTVDPDALDRVLDGPNGVAPTHRSFSFRTGDLQVRVCGDQRVFVRPVPADRDDDDHDDGGR